MAELLRETFNIMNGDGLAIGEVEMDGGIREALEAARVLLGYGGTMTRR